jgi:L-asparaginase II
VTDAANPIFVEVTRGSMVESRHRAAVAVVDANGTTIMAAGNIDRPAYPRSAIKPLQALAFIESGAADRYGLGPREIALACASHSGEPQHVELVLAWLRRIGCSAADLECGAHAPVNATASRDLIAAGRSPGPEHNNCSGKHAGFLTLARHLDVPTAGYIGIDHPVQRAVRAVLADMFGCNLDDVPVGIDGCGIPQYGVPLQAIARGMARLADDGSLGGARRDAARRVREAIAAHPFLTSGTGRFCMRVMDLTGERALVKAGAEGIYAAAVPGRGLGIAVKIDDGAGRAAEVVIGHVLVRLAGLRVGVIRLAADAPL